MAEKLTERMSLLRWLAIITLLMLFVADYGFDVMAKPVPVHAYWALAAIALGIDVVALRTVLLRLAGVKDYRPQDPTPSTHETTNVEAGNLGNNKETANGKS